MPLPALLFAYEDRAQISLWRLLRDTNVFIVILWEKIHAIMIDSLTKNLKVGYGVAKYIGSDNIFHCISYASHLAVKNGRVIHKCPCIN